jgi:CO dehydrogenase maturation factor
MLPTLTGVKAMQRGLKIAISGKGGVGKTTICAVWSQLFAEDGLDVLAIDADSDPNLASALGVAIEDAPEPLITMKELIEERTGAKAGSVGQYFKLNPKVSDLPEKYWHKVSGIKLLVLGGTKNAGAGCACPESAFLKALLAHTILQRREAILVDLAAGLEFMGRACVQGVDAVVVVVEPGARSIETAVNIARMAGNMGIEHVAAFANKITDPGQIDIIRSQLAGIPILGSFRLEPALSAADLNRLPVVDASNELVRELKKAKEAMANLFFQERVSQN